MSSLSAPSLGPHDGAVRVAVGPDAAAWALDAVRSGGGVIVDPLDHADALVWTDIGGANAERLRAILDRSTTIEWVQLPLAGVERLFELGIFEPGRLWTSAKGVYAEPVAEHALALALAGLRRLPDRVRSTSWGDPAGVSLFDQSVTIVGGGGIARSLLGLLAPFRCDVTVIRRHPSPMPGARTVEGPGSLVRAIGTALVVVLALALTPQTRALIGRDELDAMRRDAWLVNIARGRLVDTDALVEALQRGTIAGAALDVTDPEPLPSDHPLWGLPNCLITPHTADTPEIVQRLLSRRIAENVARFGRSDELLGIVDLDLGY